MIKMNCTFIKDSLLLKLLLSYFRFKTFGICLVDTFDEYDAQTVRVNK